MRHLRVLFMILASTTLFAAQIDFTDPGDLKVFVDAEQLKVGQPMRMMFRIKDVDAQRHFRRYFWKAAPQ